MKTDNKAAEEAYQLNAVMSLTVLKQLIDQWETTNPGKRPPVVQDKSGIYHWQNRATRRAKRK